MNDAPPVARFTGLPDLASASFGGCVVWASDEFFAPASSLVLAHEPVWDADRYTDRGKWMDGWEPRRRRHPGHDTAIVKLGAPGELVGVDIDTRNFLGNHAPYASIDATAAPPDADAAFLRDQAEWTTVLSQVSLERGGPNVFALKSFKNASHVRLHIYPAGGVARLRVFGRPDLSSGGERVDLVGAAAGGQALACSDMFFSRMDNLIRPDEAVNMGDGWETKRSPLPKQDWVILALGTPGELDELLLHTRHFKGNYPTAARVDALYWPDAPPHALSKSDAWQDISGDVPLGADQAHAVAVSRKGPWTHLRLTILSDGGISRLRAFGRPSTESPATTDPQLRWLNGLAKADAAEVFARCCGARRWVAGMVAGRPYHSHAHLHGHAEHVWWHLGDGDWLEAFEHHPRIGADVAALRARFAATADWSAGEQAGMAAASEDDITTLAAGNAAYLERHGFIFIVCASGLSAAAMRARLEARVDNGRDDELRIAAGEQVKITALRIDKLTPTEDP
jgi:allantoicase